MAQHRTRKEKEKTNQARLRQPAAGQQTTQAALYSYSGDKLGAASQTPSQTLLKVDQGYILKDLMKTVSISSLLLLVVIGIYFYLRYN